MPISSTTDLCRRGVVAINLDKSACSEMISRWITYIIRPIAQGENARAPHIARHVGRSREASFSLYLSAGAVFGEPFFASATTGLFWIERRVLFANGGPERP